MNRFAAATTLAATALALAACNKTDTATQTNTATTTTAAATTPGATPANALSSRVQATRDGFLIGDPNAPVKLVEFASPTCSHCADFSRTSGEALKREFVDSGKVSWEIRPFMLNGADMLIATALDCAGPERGVALLENVYNSQEELFRGLQAGQANAQAAMAQPANQRFGALAGALGLDRFFAARGMTGDQLRQCLSNPAKIERWQESTQRSAQQYQIQGTPTFVLNNETLQGVGTWDKLKPALEAATR